MTRIVLWVDEIEEAEEFYALLLAGKAADKSETFVRVFSAENEVLLHLVPEEYREKKSDRVQVRESAAIKPIFSVKKIDAARARVAGLTGVVYSPETEQSYSGVVYCDGFDTEGNVFQLSEAR